jgi:hypothetical protein
LFFEVGGFTIQPRLASNISVAQAGPELMIILP